MGLGVLLPAGLVVALALLRSQWHLDDLLPEPLAGGSHIDDIIFGFLTLVGGDNGLVVLISVGLLVLMLGGQNRKAAFFLVAIAGARIAGRVLKAVVDVPRPASEAPIFAPAIPAVVPAALAIALLVTGLALRRRPAALAGAILIGLLGLERLTEVALPVRQGFDSFPSGHAVGSMALALATIVVTWERPRWRVPVVAAALLFTVGVGLSRVYLDLHHPADVLAGWCVALAWVMGIGMSWHIWPRQNLDRGTPVVGPAE
ncbi:MAG: phosphatase PAP2 family protein [Chloroflexota bacterium]|nr:phosphatase PAP2 family protein [Chloroflexota bacterium]